MTNQKMVEAMARLDGYDLKGVTQKGCRFPMSRNGRGCNSHPVYDSHDAVQRVIDGLDRKELIEYRDCLYRLFMDDDYVRGVGSYSVGCLRATPRQKCEAILKAKGEWNEVS